MENKDIIRSRKQRSGRSADSALLFGIKGDDKIEKFEQLLSGSISTSDSIKEAIEKMVRAALTIEFGEKMLQQKEAGNMIFSISSSIYADSELRRQSLLIMDRFARTEELNA